MMEAGTKIGRIGGDNGTYVAPPDTSPEQLALKPGSDLTNYNEYTVLKPIPNVEEATIAPWFDQPGGGTQFKMPWNIQFLKENSYIK